MNSVSTFGYHFAQIEIYKREDNLWGIRRILGIEETLFIEILGIEVELSPIYDGVL